MTPTPGRPRHLDSTAPDDLRTAGVRQATLCEQSGSPTYAAMVAALTEQVARREGAGWRLLAGDPSAHDGAMRTALHLRLLAAAGRAARAHDHPLLRYYPTFGGRPDPAAAARALVDLLEEHRDEVHAGMRQGVQTNEPRRAAPLAAAFAHVATLTRMPLLLNEVGASAGLNLSLDRYRIESVVGHAWGPAGSPVRITGSFRSGTPATTPFVVAGRRGCDLSPIDLREESGRQLLESFVWPEHVARMRLLRAATGCAEHGLVERADAVAWTRARLSRTVTGHATVLVHSVVATYFDEATASAFEEVVTQALGRASAQAPVAWVSMEPEPGTGRMLVTAAVAPFHGPRVLARCAPHGQQVDWTG